MKDRVVTWLGRARPWAARAVAGLLVTGCGPREDSRVRKARQVLTDVSNQDPQFARYALGVASGALSSAMIDSTSARMRSISMRRCSGEGTVGPSRAGTAAEEIARTKHAVTTVLKSPPG